MLVKNLLRHSEAHRFCIKAALVLSCAAAIHAQTPNEQNTPLHWKRKPDIENVRYGPYDRNELDLYLAKSDKPTPLVLYFHGGAFVVGNKYLVPTLLLDACKKAGLTVAAVNYRYSPQAPYPELYMDCARSLQFLRLHAKKYNLNPRAVASTGASAGADISCWLGFHKDMADPASADPVRRQSTRVQVIGPHSGQTTMDPRQLRKLVGEKGARNPAFPKFYGLKREEMDTERAYKMYADASAVSIVDKDSAPAFLFYGENVPITDETPDGLRIHHPAFGFYLKERMDKLGVECVLRLAKDYKGKDPAAMNEEMVRFFVAHFPK